MLYMRLSMDISKDLLMELTSTSLHTTISSSNEMNNIALLSVMGSGTHLEKRKAGLEKVMILNKEYTQDFSDYSVGFQTDFASLLLTWHQRHDLAAAINPSPNLFVPI